jgi:hypothetical protein
MRRLIFATGALATVLLGSPAHAADDSVTAKNAAGATVTFCSKDVGSGVMASCSMQVDTSGQKMTPAKDSSVDGVESLLTDIRTSLQDTTTSQPVHGHGDTITVSITRPANTTAYTANDTWADSDSAPTAGGATITGACRGSGGTGVLTDIVVVSSNDPATLLQAEIWLFDSAPTAVNDNAAFALSDSDALKLVDVIGFTLATTTGGSGTNSYYRSGSLNVGYTCSGSANLRFLVKVKNAYTPASAEVLTVRFKTIPVD